MQTQTGSPTWATVPTLDSVNSCVSTHPCGVITRAEGHRQLPGALRRATDIVFHGDYLLINIESILEGTNVKNWTLLQAPRLLCSSFYREVLSERSTKFQVNN